MTKIGIEGLATRNHKEHRAKSNETYFPVTKKKFNTVKRIDRGQDRRVIANMQCAGHGNRCKPYDHDGAKHRRDPCRAATLRRKQRNQDNDRKRHHKFTERRTCELEPFDRREHGDRRRNDGIAEKHRGAYDAENENKSGPSAESARCKGRQRQRTALAVVVGAQQDQHVFQRNRND